MLSTLPLFSPLVRRLCCALCLASFFTIGLTIVSCSPPRLFFHHWSDHCVMLSVLPLFHHWSDHCVMLSVLPLFHHWSDHCVMLSVCLFFTIGLTIVSCSLPRLFFHHWSDHCIVLSILPLFFTIGLTIVLRSPACLFSHQFLV